MALEIRSNRIPIDAGTGEQVAVNNEFFLAGVEVLSAHVGLRGYSARYVEDDNDMGRLLVRLETGSVTPSSGGLVVPVIATLQLRDEGNDHAFSGFVDYVLFVETRVRPIPDRPSVGPSR
jgi:hypothetical protein